MIAKDDYAIVLDFLPHGKPGDRRAEPVAQCIGDKYFNLLETVTKEDVTVKTKDRLYIGDDKREQVKYIKGRITYSELTSYAKDSLVEIITDLVSSDEKRFVDFFNKASSLTTRMHSLELLPGIGKRHLWDIINQRKVKQFESFKDVQERVAMLPDPKKMVIRRILVELEGKDRHKIFVASMVISS